MTLAFNLMQSGPSPVKLIPPSICIRTRLKHMTAAEHGALLRSGFAHRHTDASEGVDLLASLLSRQGPVEAAPPVHVLPGLARLLGLDAPHVGLVVLHMLALQSMLELSNQREDDQRDVKPEGQLNLIEVLAFTPPHVGLVVLHMLSLKQVSMS